MKQTRTHAFGGPSDAWLLIWPHEWDALAGLPAWATRLWCVIVSRADFKTGAVRTGYGELINELTPDQPERGPRLWAPSRDDVKAMVLRFESLRILARDKLGSEQRQVLLFSIAPRQAGKAVPARKLPRELSPGSTEGEQAKLPPGSAPGLSEKNSLPPTPTVDNLSPVPGDVRAKLQGAVEALRRGGRNRAPKGA